MPKKTQQSAPDQDADSITITLERPFDFGSESISEIIMKRPKGKHLKGIKVGQDMTLDDLVSIASRLSGHAPPVFDLMDAADLLKVAGKIGDFFVSGQETGKTA